MKNPKVLLIFLGAVALALASTQFPTPKPDIALPAETVALVLGFPVTNTLIATWVTTSILLFVAWRSTRRLKDVPSGLQNLVELALEWLLGLAENVAGKNARRFFPLITTFFLFIILNNWLGLLPGFGTIGLVKEPEHSRSFVFNTAEVGPLKVGIMPPGSAAEVKEEDAAKESPPGQIKGSFVSFLRGGNTSLSTTLALALVAVLMVEYYGISSLGFRQYASRFVNVRRLLKGQPMGLMDAFVGFLEGITETARIISFGFRLFGNMFAGEVLLLIIPFLIAWVVPLIFYGLEMFVGAIQALVFALLTLVFSTIAVTSHTDGHEAQH